MPAFRNSVSAVTLRPAVLLQPVQTSRQTKAEPLQPAVVHQVKWKLKIDFEESHSETAAFIWTYFDSISVLTSHEKQGQRKMANILLYDELKGKQCTVTCSGRGMQEMNKSLNLPGICLYTQSSTKQLIIKEKAQRKTTPRTPHWQT